MLSILHAKLQHYSSQELSDVHARFRKGRGTRDPIANIQCIMKKAREFQKNNDLYFIDYAKAFDCVDHNKVWKALKDMGIPDHLNCLLRNLYVDHNKMWKILREMGIPDHLTCLLEKPVCRSGSNS